MGLFGKLSEMRKQRNDKRLQKAISLAGSPRAIKEDRIVALQVLADIEDAEIAIPALLTRFNFSLEHGIQDEREKAMAMESILSFKEKAIEPVKNHLINSDKIAWPIKILQKLSSEEVIIESLKQALIFDDTSFDSAATDKNYDVLCYLRDYKLPGYYETLVKFLDNPDERVRFSVVECLVEQEEDEIAKFLERFVSDESAENIRIREVVIESFLKKGWRIKNTEPFLDGFVMPGIKVTKEGELRQTK